MHRCWHRISRFSTAFRECWPVYLWVCAVLSVLSWCMFERRNNTAVAHIAFTLADVVADTNDTYIWVFL